MTLRATMMSIWCLVSPLATAQGLLPTTGINEQQEKEPSQSDSQRVASWVIALSNLSATERAAYLQAFQAAKAAFAANQLAVCNTHLNTCELYFKGNPNVWLLRASICINLGRYEDALRYIKQVQEIEPDNDVVQLNLSLLHMARGNYEQSLEETTSLLSKLDTSMAHQGLRHSLLYRSFLCLLMLNREADAKELVATITPLDDSPLYYYCQAALCMMNGNPVAATQELNTADTIYATDGHLPTYKQNLSLSGLKQKAKNKAQHTAK